MASTGRRATMYLAGLCLATASLGASGDAAAQRLGRLFSTPEERALLDELRRERQLVAPDPQAVAGIVPDLPAVEQVTIDGMVLRSSGVNSAWINGRQVSGGARTREGVRVDTSASRGGRVKITLPSGAETIDLKPGQRIDVDSGVVVEAYERDAETRGLTVFNRVSPEPEPAPEVDDGEALRNEAPDREQAEPAGDGGNQYPEALLERIRRALQGN